MPYARGKRGADALSGPRSSKQGPQCAPGESGWRRGTALKFKSEQEGSSRRVMHCPAAALRYWGTSDWETGGGPPAHRSGNRFYGSDEAPFHRQLRYWINASVEHEVREMLRQGAALRLSGERVTLRMVYSALDALGQAGGFQCGEDDANGGISETLVTLAPKGPHDARTHVATETQPVPTLYAYETSGVSYAPPQLGDRALPKGSVWHKEPWESAQTRGMLRSMLIRTLQRTLNAELLHQCEQQFGHPPFDADVMRDQLGIDLGANPEETRLAMMAKFCHYSMRPYMQTRVLLLVFTELPYGTESSAQQRTPLQEATRRVRDSLKSLTDERLIEQPGRASKSLWEVLRNPLPPGADVGLMPRFQKVWRSLTIAAAGGVAGGELELVELDLARHMVRD
jgi:hypothetical protein